MSFRRKLLAVFGLTVVVSVAMIAWMVSEIARKAFEQADEQNAAVLTAQFEREFNRRGAEVVRRVEVIADSETATHIAMALGRESPNYGAFLSEAKSLAGAHQLDFLELVDGGRNIISSAQAPAKFGYKDISLHDLAQVTGKDAFLKPEELSDGVVLGLFAVRETSVGDGRLFVVGGQKLGKEFLASLELPVGTRAMLYQNLTPGFSASGLIDASGTVPQGDKLAALVQRVQQQGNEQTEIVHWSENAGEDERVHVIPLRGENQQLLGMLLVGSSRRTYVELQRHIRSAVLVVGGAGILLAILLSGWAAARVTRPVEQLAAAAKQVASGDLAAQVEASSADELGELAEAFNRMTRELVAQKERLVQTERVAAWRELARRLAHELKNPLFPLQLTVENLIRAHQQSPEQFEEVLRESSATLLSEIANLKAIISRFSEFSSMPQPQLQKVQLNELVEGTTRLFQAQLQSSEAHIACNLALDGQLEPIYADPELLHRAISNLVLNALDAMPQGGTLTVATRQDAEKAYVEVTDTGTGLAPEEYGRLFTPYYTSKKHGTGLGLAIVQSVVSDHGGRISVRSKPGEGSTFVMELPRNGTKPRAGAESAALR